RSFSTPLPLYVRRFECGGSSLFFCGVFASQVLLGALCSAAAALFGAAPAETVLPQGGALLLFCAVRTVAVPLLEELLFRGHILGRLLPFRDGAAVLLSSLLFALTHSSITQLLPAFCSGIFLAMAALRCGLGCSILLHAANNALALLLLWLQQRGPGAVSQGVYIAAAALCVLCVFLNRKKLPALKLRGIDLAPYFAPPLAAAVVLMAVFLL
ncbi:MAG: CPBP family intramembrane metalloprotease, partial [Oscillospiraceae bacterium]|nr:CPBP family intramembrane metalloprotease [Oscillospiraceae bacterium]